MRILYCNKYSFRFSGTEAYLFDTMDLMRTRGHEVALFSMAAENGTTPDNEHCLQFVDFKRQASLLTKMKLALHSIYSTDARARIRRVIQEFEPDVAHVRNIYHHLSPSILWELRAQGVPVVYHLNDFKLICPAYNLVSKGNSCERCKGGKFWNVVREGCYTGSMGASAVLAAEAYFHRWISTYEKCVDLILTPSNFAKQKLMENGWAGERIVVLQHFQDFPPYSAPHPGPNAPILYFGRLSPEKGIDDLLGAMLRLPHVRLVIAGDGPDRLRLEALARNLELGNVTFAGHVTGPALEKMISGSQFTVFPSRAYETMGKSILESYAQGRAVVASDLGSRREIVEHEKTGLLYTVGNVDQLADAISFLHSRPHLAARMGLEGRELLRQRHSREQHLGALEKLYEAISSNRKPSRVRRYSALAEKDCESRRLKIAFIGGRGVIGKYSGIETYYEEVGSRLAGMGHEVTAYCRSYFTPPMAAHRGVRIVRLPTLRTKHLETLLHTFVSTIHACFSRYDIVSYHTLGPSMFAFIPRLFGKKTVVTVQGLDWKRGKWEGITRTVLKFCEWTSARLPDKTIVVSRTLLEHYRRQHSSQCVYVPNGTQIRQRRSAGELRKLGLKPGQYALFLGRFSPEKNCHLLIEAFEQVETPMKLVLAGGSSHTDDYVARLRQHESDRIQFSDWIGGDVLEEVLTNAALFVLPSDMEGMSLALLDAMGAGVCALASDVAENREVIGGAGFTFKQGDTQDLRRMLELLLSDAALRETAGFRARERVVKFYLWDRVAAEVSAVYETVAGHTQRKVVLTRKTSAKRHNFVSQELTGQQNGNNYTWTESSASSYVTAAVRSSLSHEKGSPVTARTTVLNRTTEKTCR